jgi:hypothetical protein
MEIVPWTRVFTVWRSMISHRTPALGRTPALRARAFWSKIGWLAGAVADTDRQRAQPLEIQCCAEEGGHSRVDLTTHPSRRVSCTRECLLMAGGQIMSRLSQDPLSEARAAVPFVFAPLPFVSPRIVVAPPHSSRSQSRPVAIRLLHTSSPRATRSPVHRHSCLLLCNFLFCFRFAAPRPPSQWSSASSRRSATRC